MAAPETGGRAPIPTSTPQAALRDLAGGALLGTLYVVLAISLASLVFTGDLEAFRANAIGLALTSTLLIALVVVVLGSLPGSAVSVQDTPAAILAIMASAALAAMPPGAEPIAQFMTVVALVALTTIATGGLFLAVGVAKLGRFVRFLPYPVVGGFLAGTGWLLLTGGIGVMSDVQPSLSYGADLFAAGIPVRWLPGLAFAIVAVVVTQSLRHPLSFPALVVAAIVVFYGALGLSGAAASDWRAAGILLGPFPDADMLRPVRAGDLPHVDWGVVVRGAMGGATVMALSLLALLLNATGLELALGRKIDLNRELRSAGIGNLLAGAMGGLVGYHVLSFTLLNHRIGALGRRVSVAALVVVAAVLLLGPSFLETVPSFVVGGVIAYLGLSLLIDWVYTAYAQLSRLEYGIVIVILLAIAGLGFLSGVGIGIVLAVVLFVVDYGRVDPVRHTLGGGDARSRVRWSAADERILRGRGDGVMLVALQGFLFFGSTHAVVARIERRLAERTTLEHLVLDFRHVTGADSTAVAGLASLARTTTVAGVRLVLAAVPPALEDRVRRAVASHGEHTAPVVIVATADEALEWCERRVLDVERRDRPVGTAVSGTDDAQVLDVADLLESMERLELSAGQRLLEQGAPSDALFIVESGRLTALLETPGTAPVRLETMHRGSLVGEIGFYTGGPRGATVVADEASVVYRLAHDGLEDLTRLAPARAAALHEAVARRIAERVQHVQRVVAALQR
ncbi:MAG: SLC26A/SulP transporter family protein [Trueperaceae bacterium]|nr:SLC26A/SulP transporter family protein [Trueperaceae bacterium]